MKEIQIKNIEYVYSPILNRRRFIYHIKVTFDFGVLKDCGVVIDINDSSEISDGNIKQKILNHMNTMLERKYIDEV